MSLHQNDCDKYEAEIKRLETRIEELEAERKAWDGHKVCELLRKDVAELEAERDCLLSVMRAVRNSTNAALQPEDKDDG